MICNLFFIPGDKHHVMGSVKAYADNTQNVSCGKILKASDREELRSNYKQDIGCWII